MITTRVQNKYYIDKGENADYESGERESETGREHKGRDKGDQEGGYYYYTGKG